MRGFPLDLRNKIFGNLTAVKKTNRRKSLSPIWQCKCTCGKRIYATASSLSHGSRKSCGCMNKPSIIGRKFGRLVVLRKLHHLSKLKGRFYYLCACDCGKRKRVQGRCLISGNTLSCTCLAKEKASQRMKTHGMSKTRVHNIWIGMFVRCYKKTSRNFHNYGGRGITICKRWHKFERFYADMGEPPSKTHSIDRINGNKNYQPSNCRWATAKEQTNNLRRNVRLTYNGETLTASQWSERLGIGKSTLRKRINNYSYSHKDALEKST